MQPRAREISKQARRGRREEGEGGVQQGRREGKSRGRHLAEKGSSISGVVAVGRGAAAQRFSKLKDKRLFFFCRWIGQYLASDNR